MKRQTSYAYLGTREIVEAFSPFNIFLCIQYCVVGNASLEVSKSHGLEKSCPYTWQQCLLSLRRQNTCKTLSNASRQLSRLQGTLLLSPQCV